ncbi:MmgE/PrpD family protein, partial [Chloroflexota bacterium]
YVREMGGREDSTIVNYGDKTPAENAAFVNSTFGHGFELDDLDTAGASHPGCVIVPATLAIGEKELISGKDFILATALGYEVMGRIGKAVRPTCQDRGFHLVGLLGTFGAATVGGKILAFDAERMLNALSIASSHSSGLMEYNQTGGMVKRIHPGIASHGGLRAAFLAEKGLTGPPTILEGKNGFCSAFSDEPHIEKITANLGKEFIVMGVGFKLHSCCGLIHSALDAVAQMAAQYGITPGTVKEINVKAPKVAIRMVGAIREPKEVATAQFSMPFSIGLNLVKGGNNFWDYTKENLTDPEILTVARKVRMEAEEEFDAEYPPKILAWVEIKLESGKSYDLRVDYPKGTAENPLTNEEIENKFRSLASKVLPEGQVEEIIKVVDGLEHLSQISILSNLLVSHQQSQKVFGNRLS